MIYLDNAATAKPLSCIAELAAEHAQSTWLNPSAMYLPSVETERRINAARESLKKLMKASNFDVTFTSGGTESANQIIFSGYPERGGAKKHFITSSFEHPCVYECFRVLAERGHDVSFIDPVGGSIRSEDVAAAVRPDTVLVSIMHVNNETGALNDIAAIAAAAKSRNPALFFHSDGVQGFIKCPVALDNTLIDYYTVSAHKLGAIKGTGATFHRKGTPLRPYLYGGGQEKGLRSGTENTLGILALAAAAEQHAANHEQDMKRIASLREAFLRGIAGENAKVISPEDGAGYILSVSFPDVRAEVLVHLLEQKEIYISTGSACSSKKGKQSRITRSLKLTPEIASGTVRLSFCGENTEEEMQAAAAAIKDALKRFGGFKRR